MKQTDLYQAIFRRKAIRKYDLTSFDEKTITGIRAFMNTLTPMDASIKTEFKLLPLKDIRTMLPKAPYYIAAFSETKDGYLTNIGFMLQQMDLFLSVNGIGACWQGMSRPSREILKSSPLKFVIVLALGKPDETLYRDHISEFRRKPLKKISDIAGADDLLEPARLAPSGINSQPWYFRGDNRLIHAYCAKSGFIKAIIYEDMNRIDMGIALCHLWIAAQHFGKKTGFISDETARSSPPSKYYYITTIKVE